MKDLFLVAALLFGGIVLASAQDINIDGNNKYFSNPLAKKKPAFAIPPLTINKDSLTFIQSFTAPVQSISIPNAYQNMVNIIYTTPVKKLSGNNLAPMPGTENLDKLETDKLKDSKSLIRPLGK